MKNSQKPVSRNTNKPKNFAKNNGPVIASRKDQSRKSNNKISAKNSANSPREPILLATNLTKIYGRKSAAFRALDDVDLQISRGESVAIIGKSGSGKSTLMHLLALLDSPTSGKIFINGKNSGKLRIREINKLRNKNFGFVFQQFFMNSRDSVLHNVELPLKIAGVNFRERKKRALEALKIVELDDKAKSRANDLSGGQKQRVCIARAIVNDPSVIFADEPTGNLDSATGMRVENLLFNLNREKNITLIIVTHDPDLAAKCDREIHIHDGRIVQEFSRRQPRKSENMTSREKHLTQFAKSGVKT